MAFFMPDGSACTKIDLKWKKKKQTRSLSFSYVIHMDMDSSGLCHWVEGINAHNEASLVLGLQAFPQPKESQGTQG